MQGSLLAQPVELNVTVLQATQFNHWMVVSKLSWKPLAPKTSTSYHVCFTGYWWPCEVDMSLEKMPVLIDNAHGEDHIFCMCFGCVCFNGEVMIKSKSR